jgi:hypothetical protein
VKDKYLAFTTPCKPTEIGTSSSKKSGLMKSDGIVLGIHPIPFGISVSSLNEWLSNFF